MSLLNPSKLRDEVEARELRKIKVFEHILDICYNKILITNQQCDDCCCIFACPSVVFGLPLFNLMDCIRYIMIKLVEKGFEVHLAVPNNIYISWKQGSNPDYSRKMYQLENNNSSNGFLLTDKPNKSYGNSSNYGIPGNSSNGEYKLFASNKNMMKKEKTYRPIEDYRQNSVNNNYNSDDIDIFRSKIDEILL
jgi:hypothetical protein